MRIKRALPVRNESVRPSASVCSSCGWGGGRRSVEENTSKVYVGTGVATSMNASPGGGSALFIINLCASIAPVQISGKNLPGLDNYRLYQVARVEDGRTRHRLRLGFFTSESHAESVLAVVRQQYPSAFTACLCDEDRRFARGYLPESAVTPAPAKPPMTVVSKAAPAPQQPAVQAKQVAPPPPVPAKSPAPIKSAAPVETKVAQVPVAAKAAPATVN